MGLGSFESEKPPPPPHSLDQWGLLQSLKRSGLQWLRPKRGMGAFKSMPVRKEVSRNFCWKLEPFWSTTPRPVWKHASSWH